MRKFLFGGSMKDNVISILCPTRGRPQNVIKLVNTARKLAEFPNLLEFLFYVDNDDSTFPLVNDVTQVRGPRIWISNAHNVLYTYSTGEILMTAGDDMEFLTKDWDSMVRKQFDSIDDKIALVYGNDLGTHAGKLAVHGFFHRKWIDSLGTWVQPGRGSLWDLWSTEVARGLGRLIYIPSLHIKHVHYRQGDKEALYDDTYKYVSINNKTFNPKITYDALSRERRIDHILLAEQMNSSPPIDSAYYFSTYFVKLFRKKLDLITQRRILILSNIQFILLPLKIFINRIRY